MRKFLTLLIVFLLLVTPATPAMAASQQAYRDYLFQFDRYRKAESEFSIARSEYEKFRSLAAETTALEKTKNFLRERDGLLRTYVLLLAEKLKENPGVVASQRQLYGPRIVSELTFLDQHAALIAPISSIADAQLVSGKLETHWDALQRTIRQTMIALIIGNLTSLATSYDQAVAAIEQFVQTNRQGIAPVKRTTIDRWVREIYGKRTVFQQQLDAIAAKNATLADADTAELERQFTTITQEAEKARRTLAEGGSFLTELITVLKYEE